MARTAPVPNIPAIPGMCPGAWVMAGGGGGGGGSGKGGSGDGGDQGAGDASGDAQDGGDSCGDPVCPITGRMFIEVLDFAFSGPFPLRFIRRYNSRTSTRIGELGAGWSHVFGWRLYARRRAVVVIDDHAKEQRFQFRPGESVARNDLGWELSTIEGGWLLRQTASGTTIHFGERASDGFSYMSAISDRSGNTIAIERDEHGQFQGFVDSAGRRYRVGSDRNGRVTHIEIALDEQCHKWLTVAAYAYDTQQDLRAARDAEGGEARYAYRNHLLIEHRTPIGLSYCYRYDGEGEEARCVETWGEYIGNVDPALAEPLTVRPSEGPDERKIKGIHYVRFTYVPEDYYCEAEDGIGGVRRFFGDANGRVVREIDTYGGVTETLFDEGHSAAIGHCAPDGTIRQMRRDADGNSLGFIENDGAGVLRYVDSQDALVSFYEADDHFVRSWHEEHSGHHLQTQFADGTYERFGSDHRGLLAWMENRLGAITRFSHDAMGNCVRIDFPDGLSEHMEFDYLGRRIRHVDVRGGVTTWRWDQRNDIVYKRAPDGGELSIQRDAGRKITRMTKAGRVTQFEYGGMSWLIRRTDPDRAVTDYRYDLEGNVVIERNPRGQEQHWRYDSERNCVYLKTFEGVESHAGHDIMGREITLDTPLGRRTTEFDEGGRVVAVETPGGDQITMEYVAAGPAVIDNGVARLERSYNLGREIERDRQGRYESKVGWRAGHLSSIVSNVGLPVSYTHDVVGRLDEVVTGDTTIRVNRPDGEDFVDSLGHSLELRKHFGRNGLLEHQALGRSDSEEGRAGDSAAVVWRVDYEYDEHRNLTAQRYNDGRRVEFELDEQGRVTERRRFDASGAVVDKEELAYDAAGSVRMSGARYDALGRASECRGEMLTYDAVGRLVSRLADDGVWRYEYSDFGDLVRVKRPDREVFLEYDGVGRLVRKRVLRKKEVVKQIAYVWMNQMVLHEVDELAGSTRSYIRDPRNWSPLGHVDASAGGRVATFYLTDPTGSLDCAVDLDGNIVWQAERTVFGDFRVDVEQVHLSVRMPNQHDDADVGLVYNRYRWYDPRLGAFISPDLDVFEGSVNPRDYSRNPYLWSDPRGLAVVLTAAADPPPVSDANEPHSANGQTRPATPTAAGEVDLMQPGAWATEGSPDVPGYVACEGRSRTSMRGIGKSIRGQVDAAGAAYGCHSCGRKSAEIHADEAANGRAWNGHFIPDHQPPKSAVKAADRANRTPTPGEVRLYPHCPRCARTQGGQCGAETRASNRCSNANDARIGNAVTVMGQNNPT